MLDRCLEIAEQEDAAFRVVSDEAVDVLDILGERERSLLGRLAKRFRQTLRAVVNG